MNDKTIIIIIIIIIIICFISLSITLSIPPRNALSMSVRSVTNTQNDKESDISTRKKANLDGQIALKTVRRNTLKFQVSALFLHSS